MNIKGRKQTLHVTWKQREVLQRTLQLFKEHNSSRQTVLQRTTSIQGKYSSKNTVLVGIEELVQRTQLFKKDNSSKNITIDQRTEVVESI